MTNEAEAAPPEKSPPKVEIPAVSSTGQRSGVTAGYVNQLTQTVLPTLVRGPQLERFKNTFTTGSKLYRAFNSVLTDPQIDDLCIKTDEWVNDAFQWIRKDVSEYAGERFLFRKPSLAMSYSIPGEHAAGYSERWGNCRTALSEFLVNLDQLMRDPSIYPDPAPDE